MSENLKKGKKFSSEYQPREIWTEKRALKLGDELIEWMREKENIFFEEFLLIENDYYDNLTNYLAQKFPSFSNLLSHAKRIQEIKLKKYGVSDDLNAPMTKFVLTNNHGYSEKSESKSDITSNGKDFDIRNIYGGSEDK